MGVELFILLLDFWGYHWTDYARCKYPEFGYECEIDPRYVKILEEVLTY